MSPDPVRGSAPADGPGSTAYPALGVVALLGLALGVAYCLLRKPLTLYDGIDPIIAASQAGSVGQLFRSTFDSVAYFRPLRFVQIKLLYDWSGGHLFEVYAGFHVLLTLAAAGLVAGLVRPRDALGFVALVVSGTIFFGLHTAHILFFEAYPINHFLEIIVLMLLAVFAAARCRGWVADFLACGAVLLALGTLESGVLVWLALVVAWWLGFRGVTRWGLAASVALMAIYAWIRIFYLELSSPGLDERSTGFGFVSLDPPELVARFSGNPLPLYGYNIVTSFLSVLVAEPRAGMWLFVRQLMQGGENVWPWVNVVTSSLTTALLLWFTVRRLRQSRESGPTDADRYLVLFWTILPANAVLSYAYTKDVIMSPAGALYAVAACGAIVEALRVMRASAGARRVLLAAWLVVLSTGWSMRTAGVIYGLRYQAFRQANDWAFIYEYLDQEQMRRDPEGTRLTQGLRWRMMAKDVPIPYLVQSRTLERWLDQGQ